MKTNRDADVLLERYICTVIEYGEALEQGDHKRTNKAHAMAMKLSRMIVNSGSENLMLGLLEHPNASVRCWAALEVSHIAPHRSKEVLQAIVDGPTGPLRMMAEISLGELKKRNPLQ